MKCNLPLLSSLLIFAVSIPTAHAAISVTSDEFTYSQTFDTLITTGTAQAWANNSTIAGWSLYNSANAAITTYNAGDGSTNTGAFNSFGTAASTDRALGGTASGGTYFGSPGAGLTAGYITVALTNNTEEVLPGINIAFNGEQWRNGGNTSTQTMVLEYALGGTFAGITTWSAPGGNFNFTSPVVGATPAAVNGNVAGLGSNLGGKISDLNWVVGETLWIRWIERNDLGSDHGIAIDNFAVLAVPEPASALLGAVGLIGLLRRRRR